MNILVLGSGGREHTFAWKIAQSEELAWPEDCTTICSTWTYQMGYSYGCSIVNWPSSDVNEAIDYYMHTCGCFNYAVGILEGYAQCLQPSGDLSDNDGNSTCTQYNPRTKEYEQVPC